MPRRGGALREEAAEDRLTLWISTQTPHAAQRLLCDMLGRDENQIRVITPDVGGGFGPKLVFYQEEVVTGLAALLLRRPVKWIEDRRENLIASAQERDRNAQDISIAVDMRRRGSWGCAEACCTTAAPTPRAASTCRWRSAHTVTLPWAMQRLRVERAAGFDK